MNASNATTFNQNYVHNKLSYTDDLENCEQQFEINRNMNVISLFNMKEMKEKQEKLRTLTNYQIIQITTGWIISIL